MIPKEMVLKDGETVTLGNTTVRALPLRDIPKEPSPMFTRFMQTVKNTRLSRSAGVGLNAIKDKSQLEEYIRSLDKLSSNKLDISVNLTAHPSAPVRQNSSRKSKIENWANLIFWFQGRLFFNMLMASKPVRKKVEPQENLTNP